MRTVLVVEDEKLIRQGISTMIKRCGVPVEEVIECANGSMPASIRGGRIGWPLVGPVITAHTATKRT